MHLTTSLPVVRSELHLEAVGVQTFVSQQGVQRRTCASNHGNLRRSLPLLSSNRSSGVAAQRLKTSPGAPPQLLPPSPGYDRLYQTTTEEADAHPDIWTVIKPGHVREKIAIFASDGGRAADSRCPSAGSSGSRDRTAAAACTNHAAMSGLLRASKAKGSWEENSNAKRRRRSAGLQQDLRTRVLEPSPWRPDVTPQAGGEAVGEGEEERVSVVEMVAFLEQRVSEQQPESKPLLTIQRSSTTITLSRAPPPPPPPGGVDEAPESVRVSDMVAKLESDCLRRRTEGSLSRSNSLRRTVGRVLLAGGERSHAPCLPPAAATSLPSSQSLLGVKSTGREPISRSEATPSSAEPAQEAGTKTEAPPPEQAEPVPGLLFLSLPSAPSEICPHPTEPRPCTHSTTFDLAPLRRASSSSSDGGGGGAAPYFLEMRQRLQQLLEPTPYLSLLPHHLLLQVLLLLPTRSLAALKCTCRYFRFVIETYAVRPADSLWVSDPRYRDDPCKQCKKRYGRGDVSLCRWHHKPFCQALPYGPGYWMCCHGAHRDTPGCNVGLHDNRWVPAFHSLNVPIYRKGHHDN